MSRMCAGIALLGVFVLLGGCQKDDKSANSGGTPAPRDVGQFNNTNTSNPTTRQANATPTTGPAGNMPNDSIHAAMKPGMDITPTFTPPEDWQPKPVRNMTDQVLALPKAEGDPEDGDLAISHLTQHIPMQGNMARWCSFFGYSTAECEQHTKKQELQGTKFPTVVVDISGTYKGSSMMGPSAPPKENYRMLVAEVRTPQQPYYVRLIGPKNTVGKWEEAFMKMVREAK